MSVIRTKSKTNPWKAEAWFNNKRIKSKSFPTKREAELWKKQYVSQLVSSPSQNKNEDSRTFDDLLERYQRDHLPTIRIETARRYEVDINYRIRPFFQYLKLSAITPDLIEEFRATLLRGDLAPKSVNNSTDLLRSIFNKALKWGWIDKTPFKIDRIKVGYQPYNWWKDRDQVRAFIEVVRGDRYEAAYRLGVEYGLRLAEIIGLSKQDVSFDLGRVHVHRQWIDKQKSYGPPKHNKDRYLSFDPDSDFGRALKNAVDASPHPEAIFVTRNGARVLNRKLASDLFQYKVRSAGLPMIRFHDLRHTFASWFMIQNGNIWKLMNLLGHSSIKTTMRYAHHSGKKQEAPNLDWGEGRSQSIQQPRLFPAHSLSEV